MSALTGTPFLITTTEPAGPYNIERCIRLNSADSAFLSRTPASAGNRKTWTWAGWVKKTTNGSYGYLFDSNISGTQEGGIRFLENDSINIWQWNGSADVFLASTNAVFRDNSAWLHLVVAFDTTQATAADRIKVYINGTQTTLSGSYPTQNADANINAAVAHAIGRQQSGSRYFSGYLADIHFIDGQALTPTSFGRLDANNVWQPKAYIGGYSTNGFQLKFADNSAATAAALGKDTSGNGNNWTPTNLSVTAGVTNDSFVDSPTSYGTDTGAGGTIRGNYATLSTLIAATTNVSDGNLSVKGALDGIYNAWDGRTSTIGVSSGKWYFEVTPTANGSTGVAVGVSSIPLGGLIGATSNGYSYLNSGNKYNNNVSTAYGASWTTNDVIGCALDVDAGTVTFYKNGVSQGTAFASLSSSFWYFGVSCYAPGTVAYINFGQRPFSYTAPSNHKCVCTANLPTPTIANGATAMDVKLYTGNGSTQNITGLNFSPDLVWIKSRTNPGSGIFHTLLDAVRGQASGYYRALFSNSADSEDAPGGVSSPGTVYGGVTALNSDGFTLASGSSDQYLNKNTTPYVAWAWDAGSSTVTNTSGSISSQVRANASAGFSIVTYTGNGVNNATVGHGLGVAPSMAIFKSRNTATLWRVIFNNGPALSLNSTSASPIGTGGISAFGSTTFTLVNGYATGNDINVAATTYVAYCFAAVSNYSSFGTYTGNGSTDGTFVYLGFRPAVVMIKMSSSTGNWIILDDKREGYNVDNDPLYPNLSDAEGTTDLIDILSTGFKLRSTDASVNANTGTYAYAAWASIPFIYGRAR